MLEYRTPQDISPYGLPKVYFCGDSKNLNNYFDVVTEAIWKQHSCVVFYKTEDVLDNILDKLNNMQLFVLIISRDNLFDKNNIIWSELQYAIDNGIAYLPILESQELAAEFNKIYGTIHCLNMMEDLEMQSKRFESFLDKVLLWKENSRIDKCFRAKYFLSYRKKDSDFIPKLMRVIHKNKNLLDVAFWYDEYLIPGEDFNSAIEQAIVECDAFMLTITPSIAEKVMLDDGKIDDNYVVKNEYPVAHENGKIILPIDMKGIEADKLSVFEKLPEIISVKDEESLWQKIESLLNLNSTKGINKSSVYEHYLGLAYLNGINVEVDRKLAVELLSASANRGTYISICKLVDMYKNGIGVKVNRQEAAFWQEKKVNHLSKIYSVHKDDKVLLLLLAAYITLGDLYIDLEKSRDARNLLKKAVETGESFKQPSLQVIIQLATCYERLGRIYLKNDKQDERGIRYTKKYVETIKKISKQNNNFNPLLHADALRREAIMVLSKGNLYDAISILESAIIGLEKCDSLENNISNLRMQASIKEHIANAYQQSGKSLDAKKYFEACLDLRKKIVIQKSSVETRRELMCAYNNYAISLMNLNDSASSVLQLLESIKIGEQLLEETDMTSVKVKLLQIYANIIDFSARVAVAFKEKDKQKTNEYLNLCDKYQDITKNILESLEDKLLQQEYDMLTAIRERALADYDFAASKIEGEIAILCLPGGEQMECTYFIKGYSHAQKLFAALAEQHYPNALEEYVRTVLRYSESLYRFKLYERCEGVYLDAIAFLDKIAQSYHQFSIVLFILRVELMIEYGQRFIKSAEEKEYIKKILKMFDSVPLKYREDKEIKSHKINIENALNA